MLALESVLKSAPTRRKYSQTTVLLLAHSTSLKTGTTPDQVKNLQRTKLPLEISLKFMITIFKNRPLFESVRAPPAKPKFKLKTNLFNTREGTLMTINALIKVVCFSSQARLQGRALLGRACSILRLDRYSKRKLTFCSCSNKSRWRPQLNR